MHLGSIPAAIAVTLTLASCGHSAPTTSHSAPEPVTASTSSVTAVAPTTLGPVASTTSAPVAAPERGPVVHGLPPGVADPPSGTNQLVTVVVADQHSTEGMLQAWQRSGPGWTNAIGPVRVRVGTAGVGPTREGLNRTPRGSFPLPSAFGRLADPGTALRYRQVSERDWWVSDSTSPHYNTYQQCVPGGCSFDERAGENLGRAGASYDYAIVIGYNTDPVTPGAGSAFFLHVDAGVPSQGCVETPRATVVSLLRWLNPSQQPRITIT